jgi:hypothetical protein
VLVDKPGPLEIYVADKLGILSQAIPMFSAEQVDGFNMALDNIERGSAAIISDQIGCWQNEGLRMASSEPVLSTAA